jgi:hypothetical protein
MTWWGFTQTCIEFKKNGRSGLRFVIKISLILICFTCLQFRITKLLLKVALNTINQTTYVEILRLALILHKKWLISCIVWEKKRKMNILSIGEFGVEINWLSKFSDVGSIWNRNRNKFINQIRAPGGHIQITIMIDTQQQYIKLNIRGEISIIVMNKFGEKLF